MPRKGGIFMDVLARAFPNATQYSELTDRMIARERGVRLLDEPFSERHLHCVWYDATYRPTDLQTLDGEPVEVLHAGQWNLEAGPDFLNARIAVGHDRRVLSGDVEIHIHAADWHHHGHASDTNYSNVIAHVTYWPGRVPVKTLPRGTIQISLQEPLSRCADFYFASIDTGSYPYGAPAALNDLLPAAWRSYTVDKKRALLRAAGESRLAGKADAMSRNIKSSGHDQTLWQQLLIALGYKQNRRMFAALAKAMPVAELNEHSKLDTTTAFAILLGIADLMPTKLSADATETGRAYLRTLWDIWWKHRDRYRTRCLDATDWTTHNLRPQNHPIRRIAAAANLACRHASLNNDVRHCQHDDPQRWLKQLDAWLNIEDATGFWQTHLNLNAAARPATGRLIGQRRRAAMLTNVIVPFLAAEAFPISPLLRYLPPEQDSHSIKLCATALFGTDHNPAEYRHGILQQGLIQVFHDAIVNAPHT